MSESNFTCPRGSGRLRITEDLIGRWVCCPRCGMEFAAFR
jgi:hypothetical protein